MRIRNVAIENTSVTMSVSRLSSASHKIPGARFVTAQLDARYVIEIIFFLRLVRFVSEDERIEA